MSHFLFAPAIHGYKLLSIPWNIVLILLPCFVVWGIAKVSGRRPWKGLAGSERFALLLLFLFWLAFFPNTAYQFVVPRHLVNYCTDFDIYRVCPNETWLVVFLFTYAALGIPAFYYSCSKMAEL